MNAVSAESDEGYVRKNLKENLKITIVIEFFISTFTFNIWNELIIIPIVVVTVMMDAIADMIKITMLYINYCR